MIKRTTAMSTRVPKPMYIGPPLSSLFSRYAPTRNHHENEVPRRGARHEERDIEKLGAHQSGPMREAWSDRSCRLAVRLLADQPNLPVSDRPSSVQALDT